MAAANKGPKKRTKQLNISTIISGDGRPIRLARIQEENRSSSAGPSSPVDSLTDIGGDVQEDGWSLKNGLFSTLNYQDQQLSIECRKSCGIASVSIFYTRCLSRKPLPPSQLMGCRTPVATCNWTISLVRPVTSVHFELPLALYDFTAGWSFWFYFRGISLKRTLCLPSPLPALLSYFSFSNYFTAVVIF